MKKRMKMVITSAMLAFSLALMSFGVFAASTHSLGINNYIMFDIGENIACDIEAVSAIGTSPSVTFGGTHNNSKTLNISADMASNSGQFTAVGGNTPLSQNGKWEPWTVDSPAGLTMANDTVYWLFKVTNTSENAIQVRTRELSRQDRYQRTILYGRSASEVPNDTESGFLEKDDTVYVLVALETLIKTKNVAGNISFNIVIEPAGASYLLKNWKDHISDEVLNNLSYIQIGNSIPGEYTESFNIGATDKVGDTPLEGNEEDNPYVNQVVGYFKDGKLSICSSSIIYAPVDSSSLFSGLDLDGGDFISNGGLDTSNTTDMLNMFFGTNIGYMEIEMETYNVENMEGMFFGSSISNISLDFDTMRVTSFDSMFMECEELNYLDLSTFYISENSIVVDFINMYGTLTTPYYVGKQFDACLHGSWHTIQVNKSGDASDDIG